MKKKILFVSHDASRTGAPIVFKHLIEWVKHNTDYDFTIFIKNCEGNRGLIEDDFEALGPVVKWPTYKEERSFFTRLSKKISRKLFRVFPGKLKAEKFDLIYLNTVDTFDAVPFIKKHQQCPVLLHVHENEYSIRSYFTAAFEPSFTTYFNRYIAVSENTRKNLIENFNLPANKIDLVNEFVPVKGLNLLTPQHHAIINKLKPNNEFIVGGSGTADWRKGVDLFVQLAALCKRQQQSIKFVWVGSIEQQIKHQLSYEISRFELNESDIVFTGSVPNPQDYFNVFDIFTLTSREDPFPLVCLEAANLGKPVICFDNAGGMPEMVGKGGGAIVPYGDIQAMADVIVDLKNNPDKLNKLGNEARTVVQQYDVSVQAPKIVNIINQMLAGK